jgi:eukaryotic-like serine/threonine-protein kinase
VRGPRLLEDWLARRSGEGLAEELPPPRVSVNYGSAGIAYVFYRVARLWSDRTLLSVADQWAARAERESRGPRAFVDEEKGLMRAVVGDVSIFHSVTGVHLVQGLVALELNDVARASRAIRAFAVASRRPCASSDLTLGRAATLLGCAALIEALPAPGSDADRVAIAALGDGTLAALWPEWEALPRIGDVTARHYTGIAHGWGGFLYSTLRWCDASGAAPPAGLAERLQQLAELAVPVGRRRRWPTTVGSRAPAAYWSNWCNGTSGLVHLWLLAHGRYGDGRWLSLAEGAGWDAWEGRDSHPTLCCGLVGHAYAHLALFRHTRERVWLQCANTEAGEAAVSFRRFTPGPDNGLHPSALYKGDGGLAVLAADLVEPLRSALPLFEREPAASS